MPASATGAKTRKRSRFAFARSFQPGPAPAAVSSRTWRRPRLRMGRRRTDRGTHARRQAERHRPRPAGRNSPARRGSRRPSRHLRPVGAEPAKLGHRRPVGDRFPVVIVPMRRRAPDEEVEEYRERTTRPEGEALRDRLAAWATSVEGKVGLPVATDAAWGERPTRRRLGTTVNGGRPCRRPLARARTNRLRCVCHRLPVTTQRASVFDRSLTYSTCSVTAATWCRRWRRKPFWRSCTSSTRPPGVTGTDTHLVHAIWPSC